MKLLYFKLFRPKILLRYNIIQVKKEKRILRVKKAIQQLNIADDVAMIYQYDRLCKVLKIKNNKAARLFINKLCYPKVDIIEISKKIPLI